jgi:hypothetical protein
MLPGHTHGSLRACFQWGLCKGGPKHFEGPASQVFTRHHAEGNFIQESINCVMALLERGYHQRMVFKVLRRFLYDHFYLYGDSRRSALWDAVSAGCSAGLGAENAPQPV